MAAASSSSSAATRRRVNPDIPLITCPDCRRFKVLELVVQTSENGNKGRVFYICPGGGKRGRGCQYYRWEDEYLREVEAMKQKPQQGQEENKKMEEVKMCDLELKIDNLVAIGNEILVVLKCIGIVCVCGVMWNAFAVLRR